jgi:hypothetical protein
MTSPERLYHGSVRVFSLVLIALGLGILIATLAAGGGPLSTGVLLGVLFLAVGAGRLWISRATGCAGRSGPSPATAERHDSPRTARGHRCPT